MPHSTTSVNSTPHAFGRWTSSVSTSTPHNSARLAVSISRVHLGFCFIKSPAFRRLFQRQCAPGQTSIRMGRIIGLRLVRR